MENIRVKSFWKFVSKWSFRASMSMVAVYIFSMVWGSDNMADAALKGRLDGRRK